MKSLRVLEFIIYMLPGGVRNLLPSGFKEAMQETLKKVEETFDDVERVLLNNAVFKKRTVGISVIKKE